MNLDPNISAGMTSSSPLTDFRAFEGPIKVTLAYMAMYYGFIIGQVVVTYYLFFAAKKDKDKKVKIVDIRYNNTDPLKLTVDRSVGNTLEQMVPFLAGLWICAVFVSPSEAERLGWIYVISRSFYPFLFYLGGNWRLGATLPNYYAVFNLWKSVFLALRG